MYIQLPHRQTPMPETCAARTLLTTLSISVLICVLIRCYSFVCDYKGVTSLRCKSRVIYSCYYMIPITNVQHTPLACKQDERIIVMNYLWIASSHLHIVCFRKYRRIQKITSMSILLKLIVF